ncbi:MAG: NAD-dependent protein deacetylase [Planctomycetaceae bacterium]|nr:NAD-dependent protein deacetylase [Planctomycetaceae bacterium]
MDAASNIDASLERAAAAIASADALLIGAGAGMGVDSGLPDFRGDQGFWKAYPPFRGRRFADVSNPVWFRSDPAQAWGFFGHRLNLYRTTSPHAGFDVVRRWVEPKPRGHFVFTSNVDGHFQRAGFAEENVLECHGSIHHLQCAQVCDHAIWPADELAVAVDDETIRATSELPTCPNCQALARPNILMFGDYDWISARCDEQHRRYVDWFRNVHARTLTVIEFGAGVSVPTVRYECEARVGKLIRVNPRDSRTPEGVISLPLGALEAIERIDALL